MHPEVKKFHHTNTRFWLEGGSPSFNDLSSLKAIVAGLTIMMEPGNGPPARFFMGLDHRPLIAAAPDKVVLDKTYFNGFAGKLARVYGRRR